LKTQSHRRPTCYCDTIRFLVHIFRLFPIIFKISQKRYFHVSGSVSMKQRISLGEDSDLKTNVMLSTDIFGDTKMCLFSVIIHILLFTAASFIVCKSGTYCPVKLKIMVFYSLSNICLLLHRDN